MKALTMRLPWMSRSDRRRWRSARTVADLGELVALWLTGEMASQPGYQPRYGPDPETVLLVPALAAANRAGYLTQGSQPGHAPKRGWDGAVYAQRPAVEGHVADPGLLRHLVEAAQTAGLHILIHDQPGHNGSGLPVTTRDGEAVTGFGAQLDHTDLATIWDTCTTTARQDIAKAVQLTIIDPEYAPNTRLWNLLHNLTPTTHQ